MAYEVKTKRDDEEEQQQGLDNTAAPSLPTPTLAFGERPNTRVGVTQAPGVDSYNPAAAGAGGKFVNFDRILNANKDAAQSQANALTGQLTSQAQAAQGAVNAAKTGFDAAVSAGSNLTGTTSRPAAQTPTSAAGAHVAGYQAPSPPAQTTVKSLGAPAQARAPQGLGTPAAAAPASAPSLTPQAPKLDVFNAPGAFQQTYTGPNSVDEFDAWKKAVGQAAKSDQDLAALGQPGGLEAFAKQQAGAGADYTQGMGAMDAALLGSVGQKQFKDLSDKYGGLGEIVEKGANDSNARALSAREGMDAYNKKVREDQAAKQAVIARVQDDTDAANRLGAAAAGSQDALHSGNLNGYQRGAWGQFDPFGAGDARKFIGVNQQYSLGYSEPELKQIYENMTPDEYLEFRWLEGTGGQKSQHPDMPTAQYKGQWEESKKQMGAAFKRFLDKLKAKYVK